MGSINFNNFKNTNYSQKNYTYTDIFLDFSQEPLGVQANSRTSQIKGHDIKVAYDLNAIKNSIVNLFNTIQGERILLPDYGCDLRKYIFQPINDSTSRSIGRTIKMVIEQWEPRVTLVNINVDAYISRVEYEVTLTLAVPFLQPGGTLNLAGLLNRQGFVFVQ